MDRKWNLGQIYKVKIKDKKCEAPTAPKILWCGFSQPFSLNSLVKPFF